MILADYLEDERYDEFVRLVPQIGAGLFVALSYWHWHFLLGTAICIYTFCLLESFYQQKSQRRNRPLEAINHVKGPICGTPTLFPSCNNSYVEWQDNVSYGYVYRTGGAHHQSVFQRIGNLRYAKATDLTIVQNLITEFIQNEVNLPANTVAVSIATKHFVVGDSHDQFMHVSGIPPSRPNHFSYRMYSSRCQAVFYNEHNGKNYLAGLIIYLPFFKSRESIAGHEQLIRGLLMDHYNLTMFRDEPDSGPRYDNNWLMSNINTRIRLMTSMDDKKMMMTAKQGLDLPRIFTASDGSYKIDANVELHWNGKKEKLVMLVYKNDESGTLLHKKFHLNVQTMTFEEVAFKPGEIERNMKEKEKKEEKEKTKKMKVFMDSAKLVKMRIERSKEVVLMQRDEVRYLICSYYENSPNDPYPFEGETINYGFGDGWEIARDLYPKIKRRSGEVIRSCLEMTRDL